MLQLLSVISMAGMLLFTAPAVAQTFEEYKHVSDTFYDAEKFDSSLFYAQKAGALLQKDSGEYSRPYAYFIGQYYGFSYHKLSDIPHEVYWYKESLRIFDRLHDTLCTEYAETLVNYAELLTSFGSFSEAEPYLLKAEVILKPYAEQLDAYGGTLNNLANIYSYTGRYSKAEGIYLEMLALVKKVLKSDENTYSAKLYGNLAIMYNKTGQGRKAIQNFTKACAILKRLQGDKYTYYHLYFSLGQAYALQKDTANASKIFKEVADSLPAKQDFVLHASALNGTGRVLQQRKPKEAEDHYLSALRELQQDERGKRIYAEVAYNLATLYAEMEPGKADSLYRALLHKFAQATDRDQYSYLQISSGFCAHLLKTGKLQEAADSLQSLSQNLFQTLYPNFEGMPQYEKIIFAQSLKSHFDLVYSLLATGKASNNMIRLGLYNLLQTKGMILTSQTDIYKEVRHSADTALKAAFNSWLKIQQVLYNQYLLPATARVFDTDSLQMLAESYERKFSVNVNRSVREDKNALLEKISKRLLPAEAAVEFVRFNRVSTAKDEPVYGAFIIKHRQPEPDFVLLCKEQRLKQLFKARKGEETNTGNLIERVYKSNNTALFSLVWKPLERHLQNSKTIYYSPAGMLNAIALHALGMGNGKLLMDKYNLNVVSDTKNFAAGNVNEVTMPAAVAVWGKMDYDKEIYTPSTTQKTEADKAILPESGTKGGFNEHWKSFFDRETDMLKTVFKKRHIALNSFEGVNATEQNFKKISTGSAGIIHISTHGFFAPTAAAKQSDSLARKMFTTSENPLLRCGLVFSGANYLLAAKQPVQGKDDGILTGYEIAQMDLSKIDLVVLSACETGLGDLDRGDEGVIGLQRAFRLAGVKKLVVSLWEVPQKTTAELMALFYENLLSGQKASQALFAAQKALRARQYPPFFWAGFVLAE